MLLITEQNGCVLRRAVRKVYKRLMREQQFLVIDNRAEWLCLEKSSKKGV